MFKEIAELVQEGSEQLLVRILEQLNVTYEGKTMPELDEELRELGIVLAKQQAVPKAGQELFKETVLAFDSKENEIIAGGEYAIILSMQKQELVLEVNLFQKERLAFENTKWKEYQDELST